MAAAPAMVRPGGCSGPHLFRRTASSAKHSVWRCPDCGVVRVIPKVAR